MARATRQPGSSPVAAEAVLAAASNGYSLASRTRDARPAASSAAREAERELGLVAGVAAAAPELLAVPAGELRSRFYEMQVCLPSS